MNRSIHPFLKPTLFLTTLLGTIFLASCNAQNTNQLAQEQALAPMESPAEAPAAGDANLIKEATPAEPTKVPQSRPQLVKTSQITLVVNSIDESVRDTLQIIKQQQGDLLGLDDHKPPENRDRQTASLQIRVPQNKLDTTLDALAKLGTLQQRNLTAEDVTTQLVDFQARLRNLRQTESSLLQIMKRTGSVGDVLKVSQELSNVRESIEQIDAQLKSLTNRVAYSTITLHLESAVSTTTPQQPLGLQVQDTWNKATRSVSEFTTDLLKLGLWLMAYSPYLLLLGGATLFGYIRLKRQPPQSGNSSSDSHLSP